MVKKKGRKKDQKNRQICIDGFIYEKIDYECQTCHAGIQNKKQYRLHSKYCWQRVAVNWGELNIIYNKKEDIYKCVGCLKIYGTNFGMRGQHKPLCYFSRFINNPTKMALYERPEPKASKIINHQHFYENNRYPNMLINQKNKQFIFSLTEAMAHGECEEYQAVSYFVNKTKTIRRYVRFCKIKNSQDYVKMINSWISLLKLNKIGFEFQHSAILEKSCPHYNIQSVENEDNMLEIFKEKSDASESFEY